MCRNAVCAFQLRKRFTADGSGRQQEQLRSHGSAARALRSVPSIADMFSMKPSGRTPDQVRQRQLATGGLRATNALAFGGGGGRRSRPASTTYGKTIGARTNARGMRRHHTTAAARGNGGRFQRSASLSNVFGDQTSAEANTSKRAKPAVHDKEMVSRMRVAMDELPFWDIAEEGEFAESQVQIDQKKIAKASKEAKEIKETLPFFTNAITDKEVVELAGGSSSPSSSSQQAGDDDDRAASSDTAP